MQKLNPLSARTCSLFVLSATLFVSLLIIGMQQDWVTFFPKAGLPRDPNNWIWFRLAQVFALGLPVLFLLIFGRFKDIRATFLPFVWILICQILAEMTLFRHFFPSVIVPNALLYIGYRLYQLSAGRRRLLLSHSAPRLAIQLSLGLVYSNLALWFLIFVRMGFRLFQLLT